MSANIFGERFLGFRKPAWHEIGMVFTEPIDAVHAVAKAKVNYEVEKYPLSIMTPNGAIELEKVAIVRNPVPEDDEYRVLGIATPTYEVVQNMDIAKILNPLTEKWPVETVGALGKGETMFLSLDAGMGAVRDNVIHQYFLVTDTKDGGTSMRIAFTPVRVVCQNTLVTGLKEAVVSASLAHAGRARSSLEIHVSLLRAMQNAMEKTMAKFGALASAAITQNNAETIFASAYPMPRKSRKLALLDDPDSAANLGALFDEATKAQASWEYYVNRVQVYRAGAKTLFTKLNDESPSTAMTAWNAYNAVVESADFREGSDSVFQSTLFGARAAEKARAFAAAMEYARI